MCFVNYLREFMNPEWVEWERVLRAFRKKGCDFGIWYKDPKYREAFLKIRSALNADTVLIHIDY